MENEEEILKGNPFGPSGTIYAGTTNMRAAGLVAWELRKLREALTIPVVPVNITFDKADLEDIVQDRIDNWQDHARHVPLAITEANVDAVTLALYRHNREHGHVADLPWEEATRRTRHDYRQLALAALDGWADSHP